MALVKKLDINRATVEEFESLNGIGRSKAESIVEQRQAQGGFCSVNDLKKIAGIGPSLLERNKSLLQCSSNKGSCRRLGRACERSRETRSSSRSDYASTSTPSGRRLRSSTDSSGITPNTPSQVRSSSRTLNTLSSSSSSEANQDSFEKLELELQDFCIVGAEDDEDTGQDDVLEEEDAEIVFKQDCEGEETTEEMEDRVEAEDLDGHEISPKPSKLTEPVSAIQKIWMKRKRDSVGDPIVDKLGISPDKKPCRDGEAIINSGCASTQSNNYNFGTIKTGSSSGVPALRKRIPSKNNPPAELTDWLKTFQAFSHPERLLALDELVALCEPTEVRHVMAVIEPQFQRDFISLLPKELALYVLSFLEPKELLRAAQTCRYWRILAEDNLLWKEKCQEQNIDEQLVYENRLRRKCSPAGQSPWKHLYMRQHEIEQNWRLGPIRPSKVLKGHDDHVITCLEFCGTRIVSGSDDNTLKVWSAVTGKCLRTLVGHTGGVWSSQMAGNIIISGSTDRTLKVWNADTGQAIHTLYGHTSTVRCMHLHENKVVSGSRDATLRVWDIDSGQCLHVLMGHVAAVRCVQYDGKKVVSGAYDYMVKVWDPENETCIHTLQGHTNRVYSLQFDGVHIVSGSLDTLIRVWDVDSGNCVHTLRGHQSLTSGMELKDNILVSGNADSTVKVWDITSGNCLQTLQGPNKHQSAVTCLQFNKKFVITSSDDGTVKIWDLKTGDFLRNLVALDSGGSGGVVWRVRCSNTKLVCAVGSRNGTEETKLLVLDFDVDDGKKVQV